jgi:hypothetical protein
MAIPSYVGRIVQGIGASSEMLDVLYRSFIRIGKTPVGVG